MKFRIYLNDYFCLVESGDYSDRLEIHYADGYMRERNRIHISTNKKRSAIALFSKSGKTLLQAGNYGYAKYDDTGLIYIDVEISDKHDDSAETAQELWDMLNNKYKDIAKIVYDAFIEKFKKELASKDEYVLSEESREIRKVLKTYDSVEGKLYILETGHAKVDYAVAGDMFVAPIRSLITNKKDILAILEYQMDHFVENLIEESYYLLPEDDDYDDDEEEVTITISKKTYKKLKESL